MEIDGLDALKSAVSSGWVAEFLFFWGHTPKDHRVDKHVLSQWWPATFIIDGQADATAEHYMMAQKAELFGDRDTLDAILAATAPSQAKKLGRLVKNYDDERWIAHRFDVAVRGNLAKFGQNPELRDWLLATGETVLVEASPVDSIWGIGLAADDKRAGDPHAWPGLNLLGFAFMKARQSLQTKERAA